MKKTDRNNLPPVLPSMPPLDEGVEAALATKPDVAIPVDFVARVAGAAASQPARRSRSVPRVGWITAWASLVAAALALFVLAPHTSASFTNYRFDAEILLLTEAAGIAWGVSRGFGTRRLP